MTESDQHFTNEVAQVVKDVRIAWGWTFGKRPKVLAIDLLIADAIVKMLGDRLRIADGSLSTSGKSVFFEAESSAHAVVFYDTIKLIAMSDRDVEAGA